MTGYTEAAIQSDSSSTSAPVMATCVVICDSVLTAQAEQARFLAQYPHAVGTRIYVTWGTFLKQALLTVWPMAEARFAQAGGVYTRYATLAPVFPDVATLMLFIEQELASPRVQHWPQRFRMHKRRLCRFLARQWLAAKPSQVDGDFDDELVDFFKRLDARCLQQRLLPRHLQCRILQQLLTQDVSLIPRVLDSFLPQARLEAVALSRFPEDVQSVLALFLEAALEVTDDTPVTALLSHPPKRYSHPASANRLTMFEAVAKTLEELVSCEETPLLLVTPRCSPLATTVLIEAVQTTLATVTSSSVCPARSVLDWTHTALEGVSPDVKEASALDASLTLLQLSFAEKLGFSPASESLWGLLQLTGVLTDLSSDEQVTLLEALQRFETQARSDTSGELSSAAWGFLSQTMLTLLSAAHSERPRLLYEYLLKRSVQLREQAEAAYPDDLAVVVMTLLYRLFETLVAPCLSDAMPLPGLKRCFDSADCLPQVLETYRELMPYSEQLAEKTALQAWMQSLRVNQRAVLRYDTLRAAVTSKAVVLVSLDQLPLVAPYFSKHCWLDSHHPSWLDLFPNRQALDAVLSQVKEVHQFSMRADDTGYSQQVGLALLPSQLSEKASESSRTVAIVPAVRPDQAAVVAYQSGPLAVIAPPGCGKTYTVVATALAQIAAGRPPSEILIVTFMDSAVQTIERRLLAALGPTASEITVSTIHALAYRILQASDTSDTSSNALSNMLNTPEAGMFALFDRNGPQVPQLIDELAQLQVLEQVIWELSQEDALDSEELAALMNRPASAKPIIQRLKTMGLTPDGLRKGFERSPAGFRRLRHFWPIYDRYEKRLAARGVMDFTDLILAACHRLEALGEARLRLLPWQLVIEDEAQDASPILERLVQAITAPHGNLIRVGDPNQAITGTFTAADVQGFRAFIEAATAQQALRYLTASARAAEPLQRLANDFLHWALDDAVLATAFVSATLTPVPGQNPVLKEAPAFLRFEQERELVETLCTMLRAEQRQAPEARIAVLCRKNAQVSLVARALASHQVACSIVGEFPLLNQVFMLVSATFQLLVTPTTTASQTAWLACLKENGFIQEHHHDEETPYEGLESDFETTAVLSRWPAPVQKLFEALLQAYGSPALILNVLRQHVFSASDASDRLATACLLQCQSVIDDWAFSVETPNMAFYADRFRRALQAGVMPFQTWQLQDDTVGALPGVSVMTVHQAKGQEFDVVYIPFVTEAQYPSIERAVSVFDTQRFEAESRYFVEKAPDAAYTMAGYKAQLAKMTQARLAEEARLLYVAITRAREKLVLMTLKSNLSGRNMMETPSRYFEALAMLWARQANEETLL